MLLIFTENFLRKQAHGLSTCKQEENDEAHYPGAGDRIGVSATKPPKKMVAVPAPGYFQLKIFQGSGPEYIVPALEAELAFQLPYPPKRMVVVSWPGYFCR